MTLPAPSPDALDLDAHPEGCECGDCTTLWAAHWARAQEGV